MLHELGPFLAAGPQAAAARFQALGRVYLDFAAANWRLWSSVFEHRATDSEALGVYMARLDAILTNIEQPLGALLPALAAEERRQLARTLFAAVHGVVTLGLEERLVAVPLDRLESEIDWLTRAACG